MKTVVLYNIISFIILVALIFVLRIAKHPMLNRSDSRLVLLSVVILCRC